MPRHVDPEQRRADILGAAIDTLNEHGFPAFTIRSLAERMGGSSTLITHYFATREELIGALLDVTLERAERATRELVEIADPLARLHAVLDYFLPADPESLSLERVRVVLAAHIHSEPSMHGFFVRLEPAMRGLVRAALDDFVEPAELDEMVDLVRVWTAGMVLSAVEHPEIWTPERQRATSEKFLASLSLPSPQPPHSSDLPQ